MKWYPEAAQGPSLFAVATEAIALAEVAKLVRNEILMQPIFSSIGQLVMYPAPAVMVWGLIFWGEGWLPIPVAGSVPKLPTVWVSGIALIRLFVRMYCPAFTSEACPIGLLPSFPWSTAGGAGFGVLSHSVFHRLRSR